MISKRRLDLQSEEEKLNKKLKTNVYMENRVFKDLFRAELDVETAIAYLKNWFPARLFALPKIVFLHQIYSLVNDKTLVDRQIQHLESENKIVRFGSDSNKYYDNETGICSYEDFKEYCLNASNALVSANKQQTKYAVDKLLDRIIRETKALSVEQQLLKSKYRFSDSDVSCVVQLGMLTIRDKSSYWFSIPNVGKFRRAIMDARKCLVDTIRKKPLKEMTLHELEVRNVKKINLVGVEYLICDMVGSENVTRTEVLHDLLLKLNPNFK